MSKEKIREGIKKWLEQQEEEPCMIPRYAGYDRGVDFPKQVCFDGWFNVEALVEILNDLDKPL